jgi:hypothetical protein
VGIEPTTYGFKVPVRDCITLGIADNSGLLGHASGQLRAALDRSVPLQHPRSWNGSEPSAFWHRYLTAALLLGCEQPNGVTRTPDPPNPGNADPATRSDRTGVLSRVSLERNVCERSPTRRGLDTGQVL